MSKIRNHVCVGALAGYHLIRLSAADDVELKMLSTQNVKTNKFSLTV